jgi:hypothetical protein
MATDPQRIADSAQGASPRLVRPVAKGLAILAAFNFLVPDLLFESDSRNGIFVAAVLVGAVASQLLLLAVWAVFGPSHFWRRWLAALAALGWLYTALVAGMIVADVAPEVSQSYTVNLFFLPLVLLCAQLPLWLLWVVLGHGWTVDGQPAPPTDGIVQFRMRDLLTTFVLIGVALGVARLAVLLHEMDDRHHQRTDAWLGLAVACAAFFTWSAVVALPCVWAAFLAAGRVRASLAAVAFASLAVVFASALADAVAPDEVFWEIAAAFFAFHGSLFLVLMTGCQVIRGWGFTLRREQPPAGPMRQAALAPSPETTSKAVSFK